MTDTNGKRCRVVVDAMGGDYAPHNIVVGALEALAENSDIDLYLVGDTSQIKKVLTEQQLSFDESHIIHSDDVIGMGESPMQSLKKKPQASIPIGARMVKESKADAFVSAGNTGAVMAASTLLIGRIKGVGRPTIGSQMPNQRDYSVLFDVGASVDSKPQHLLEYAIMGSIYVKEMFGIDNPTVGLLNVGEEKSKGNEVAKEAYSLLENSDLNFIGNVEGKDILKGTSHITVCDGFVGNILLKFGEGVLTLVKHSAREYAKRSFVNKLKALILKSVFKDIFSDYDYQKFGGVPLLGIDGITIIGHGSSTALAIKNMVHKAVEMHEKGLVEKFKGAIEAYTSKDA